MPPIKKLTDCPFNKRFPPPLEVGKFTRVSKDKPAFVKLRFIRIPLNWLGLKLREVAVPTFKNNCDKNVLFLANVPRLDERLVRVKFTPPDRFVYFRVAAVATVEPADEPMLPQDEIQLLNEIITA